ncbi:MAG: hypothetical protein NDI77_09335 [Geobacteraceae bacterium]|nr:hypothetical protein [Geobacteraceae bacterium]
MNLIKAVSHRDHRGLRGKTVLLLSSEISPDGFSQSIAQSFDFSVLSVSSVAANAVFRMNP